MRYWDADYRRNRAGDPEPFGEWLTPLDYKEWARIADDTDDPAILEAVNAAAESVMLRCPRGFVITEEGVRVPPPFMLRQAALLLTNRLMSRRNSPDGVVGVADVGTAMVLSYDADINQMLGPWSKMVLA